jgi:hypothetical protein
MNEQMNKQKNEQKQDQEQTNMFVKKIRQAI